MSSFIVKVCICLFTSLCTNFTSVGNRQRRKPAPPHSCLHCSVECYPIIGHLRASPTFILDILRCSTSQAGLTADYTAALAFAASRFPTSRLTIYGHSLGASIALCLLASHTDVSKAAAMVHGLVLENAFSNMPDMLRVLYPQRWLPYRYLGPFVCDRWDARAAAASLKFPRSGASQ